MNLKNIELNPIAKGESEYNYDPSEVMAIPGMIDEYKKIKPLMKKIKEGKGPTWKLKYENNKITDPEDIMNLLGINEDGSDLELKNIMADKILKEKNDIKYKDQIEIINRLVKRMDIQ